MAKLDHDDLKAIKDLMAETIKEKVEDGTVAGGEAIRHLPTKEEYFTRMDKLMAEVSKNRQEQTVLSQQTGDHSDRLEKLENIHPKYKHSSL